METIRSILTLRATLFAQIFGRRLEQIAEQTKH
jgi:hypothetical protein